MYSRLGLFAVIILVLALGFSASGLFAQGTDRANRAESLAVVLVVDTSGSMAGARIVEVQRAIRDFVRDYATIPTALVTFNDEVNVTQPFTNNSADMLAAVLELHVPDTNSRSAALYEATSTAANLSAEVNSAETMVILFTDGSQTGAAVSPTNNDVLRGIESSGAKVFAVGIGEEADLNYLEALATQSGGEMLAVNQAAELPAAVSQIRINVALARASTAPASNSTAPQVSAEAPSGLTPVTSEEVAPGGLMRLDRSDTAIVLAIDVSDSMIGQPMQQVLESSRAFVEAVDGSVPVALMTFGNQANIIEDFTTNTTTLQSTIDTITPGGVTALYDGAYQAVQLANQSDAAYPVVILIGDGAEYGGQSLAERNAALELATETGVQIYAVGLGHVVDEAYFSELAFRTNAEFFQPIQLEELNDIYDELYTSVLEQYQTAEVDSGIAPLAPTNDTYPLIPELAEANTLPLDSIVPLDAEFQELFSGAADFATGEIALDDAPAEDGNTVTPDDLAVAEALPYTSVFPITVDLAGSENPGQAELFINGELLTQWDGPPYDYALDTQPLAPGTYELEVAVQTPNGVTYSDTLQFELVTLSQLPDTGAAVANPMRPAVIDDETGSLRTVLVDGQETALHLTLSQETGLALVQPPQTEVEIVEGQSLTDILASPLDSLPESVRRILLDQHPVAVSIVIIILAAILLPQGIFTIYWMTYSWANGERLKRSGAPETFEEPQLSFTALLPARREEAVLYDTIMAVHNIDYPEHLKEVLVLIRDEDDDFTIAAAQRAISEIRNDAYARGAHDVADNVRLVTFKDGPRNKPNGLNRGYREASNDVICIFDAEDQPHHEVYHVINTVMQRDGADVVQSGVQLMNFRSNWFSSFNVLEYFFWFKSGLHAFTNGLNVTPLGGNTVFFKREWLDRLAAQDTEKGYRAWDEYSLTEDADVGIRLTTMGAKIQIVYEARQATQEETPANVDQFIKQRTRWSQGFFEIFFKGDWRRLPTFKQRVGAVYILLNSLLQGAILFFLPIGLFIWATQVVPVAIAILSWIPVYLLFIQLTINLIGIKEFTEAYNLKLPFLFRLRMVLYYYPYQLMLSIASVRAVLRFVTNQSSWEKTDHANLHRSASSANSTVNI